MVKQADMEPGIKPYSIFVNAFFTLSRSRTHGFSNMNPISFSDIVCFHKNFLAGITPLKFFVNIMQILDGEYLSFYSKKTDTAGKK